MQVNAETLQEKIKYLELCKLTPVLGISLNEAYQLEAYKMLLQRLSSEEALTNFTSKMVGPL